MSGKNITLQIILFISCFSITSQVLAKNIIDVYGVDYLLAKKVLLNYGNQVNEIITRYFKEATQHINDPHNENIMKKIYDERLKLINKIKADNNFYYVEFDTVSYPNNNSLYTTIEIIKTNQTSRYQFIDKKTILRKAPSKVDLIAKMRAYELIALKLLLNRQVNQHDVCPVYHCLEGFNHPQTKPYLAIFNRGAVAQSSLILNTLNQDPDPERRAAAAFLVGHFKNPDKIISILEKHVLDHNSKVRNNVMRVISATMRTALIKQIDVTPFLQLLDSCYEADRNKALFILLSAIDLEKQKKIILQKGLTSLIGLLSLKQPNNHDVAYTILLKISGKNFSEHDITAWEQWATEFAKANTANHAS